MPAIKTIFCIDDEPEILELVDMLINEVVHAETIMFPSAESALEAMKYKSPDLILMDVMMQGMNGVEAFRCIRANPKFKDTPIVFVTARARESDLDEYEKLGAPVITKPFDIYQFKDLINLLLIS